MTELHPITPPEELVQQWLGNYFGCVVNELSDSEKYLATQASQWGYEQRGAANEAELQKARDEELDACCEYLTKYASWEPEDVQEMRATRRPKPPSLKVQALEALDEEHADMRIQNYKLIRSVLESLPD